VAVAGPKGVSDRSWPWWPLLPLYPYGHRPTLVRELIAGQLWCFEQLQGVYYVAVPIRMTVLRLEQGLLLYAPVAPTAEVRRALADLEQAHGPVLSIVLPTSSGLEHKLPLPAMARAFPEAQVWVTPRQWSFPLPLPPSWLGFPRDRTRVLFEQGVPHAEELNWSALGPLDLGLGTFMEAACVHRATGTLLVTDALVSISAAVPPVFALDPTALLFHARESGGEPLSDSPQQRQRGWLRMALFAAYLRPQSLQVPPLGRVLADAWAAPGRSARNHFGLYPFRWPEGWEQEFSALLSSQWNGIGIAPVLERLVFPRSRGALIAWLQSLAADGSIRQLVAAHFAAPMPCTASTLQALADQLQQRQWAPDSGSWQLLARIDQLLLKTGVVPSEVRIEEG